MRSPSQSPHDRARARGDRENAASRAATCPDAARVVACATPHRARSRSTSLPESARSARAAWNASAHRMGRSRRSRGCRHAGDAPSPVRDAAPHDARLIATADTDERKCSLLKIGSAAGTVSARIVRLPFRFERGYFVHALLSQHSRRGFRGPQARTTSPPAADVRSVPVHVPRATAWNSPRRPRGVNRRRQLRLPERRALDQVELGTASCKRPSEAARGSAPPRAAVVLGTTSAAKLGQAFVAPPASRSARTTGSTGALHLRTQPRPRARCVSS